MAPVYAALAARAGALADGCGRRPAVVGLAGAPGSGKSTAAAAVCRLVNDALGPGVAVRLPMDGFHLRRSELKAFPDPAEAFRRRGAPWTFDAAAFVEAVRMLGGGGGAGAGGAGGAPRRELSFPGFDHGVGNPVPGAIRVSPGTRVVLLEGNYLLLQEPPWAEVRGLLDEAWFLDCREEEAMARVARRHQAVGRSREEAWERVESNDRLNARLIADSAPRADLLVPGSPPPPGAGPLLIKQRRAP